MQCPKRDLFRPFLLIENGSAPIESLCNYSEARSSRGCCTRNATSWEVRLHNKTDEERKKINVSLLL